MMAGTQTKKPLFKDRFFTTSLTSTVLVLTACVANHILVIAGVSGAIIAFDTLERGLLFAAIALAALTAYAFVKHRRRVKKPG